MVNRLETRSPLLAQLAKNQVRNTLTNGDALPAGYKRTEVGVVPVDWEVASFGEVFRYLRTGSNSRADLNDHGDVYYIHYGDLHTKKHPHFLDLLSDRLPRINSEKVKSLPHLQDGDIIISDASEDFEGIGVSVELKNTTEHLIVGGLHTIALRDDRNRIAKGYGGYLTAIPAVKDQLIRNSTGTTVYGLSKTNLSKTYFPLPPTLPEQRAIATALGDTDALLAALDALIAKQERVKRGVLEELLGGERRLVAFDGEWDVVELGKIAILLSSKRIHEQEYILSGIPFYRGKEISQLQTGSLIEDIKYISVDRYEEIKRQFGVPIKGDLLITAVGTLGNTYVVPDDDPFYFKDGNLIWIKPFESVDSYYLDYQLCLLHNQVLGTSIGSSQKALTIINLNKLLLPLPPLPEQRAIAEVLSALDAELAAVRARRAKVARVKAGMMEALLTGRVRLV